MADHKPHILSTRPIEAALLEQAAGKGVIIDTLPFIVTEPIVDITLQSHIRQLGRQPLVVVFTSMNAVEAVAGLLENQSEVAAHGMLPWRVYAIGYATQQLVLQHWGPACIAGTAASAAALADTIIRQRAPGVTFFCGDQRREELPEKLREQAIPVNEVVVYRTIQTSHKVEPVYEGIAFFSPSAVHSFFAKNSVSSGTILFAIGQTTADTIRGYAPDNHTILSGSPEKEVLIRQVIDYYNNL
ncbi:MAG TPA: uroporphyrinogen-III synthase [Puia sp.]|nr:uroporphyrinogen-III synthase [Puia sp.]